MKQIQLLNHWEFRLDKWSMTEVHPFILKVFEHLCNYNGINHSLNFLKHPQSNGQVERINGTLFNLLRANMSNDDDRIRDNSFFRCGKSIKRNTSIKTTNKTLHSNSILNIILYFTVVLYTVKRWRNMHMYSH